MRVIKYFTYEVPFLNRKSNFSIDTAHIDVNTTHFVGVSDVREKELRSIRSLLILRAAT